MEISSEFHLGHIPPDEGFGACRNQLPDNKVVVGLPKECQCQEPRRTKLEWLRQGWVRDILQDDGGCDTRTMGQRVWEQRHPTMTTKQMITSSELEK